MNCERPSSSPRMAVEEVHDDVKRRGRRVVATTDLQPGDAIFAAPPDLAVLYSPFAGHTCARCLVAEVSAEDADRKTSQRKRGKSKGQPNALQGAKNSHGDHTPTVAASSSSSPTTETALATALPAAALAHNAHICPNCDQFVLCASCVSQLVLEVEMMASAAESERKLLLKATGTTIAAADEKTLLLQHPMLRAHAISCAWYTSLPESIRAPGNDTDFLRFCLDYGARVYLGDTAMVSAIDTLEANAAVQSKEAHHLCEVFARDRVVATFGPRATAATTTTTATAAGTLASTRTASSKDEGLPSVLLAAGLPGTDKSSPFADKGVPRTPMSAPLQGIQSFPPPYPVLWTKLRDVLLRTRCNSLGFPFSASETIGWSLQETVCMVNHSCVPNAAVVMLYDSDDEQRLNHLRCADDSAQTDVAEGEEGAGTRAQDRNQQRQQQHSRRRVQRLSAPSAQESSNNSNNSSRSKNLNSYRAIAVSSPSPFSTSFTERLQGWIGIQATRPIAAGEEITVSYINLEAYGNDVQARSRHLLEQYRFLCTCELCSRQRGRKV
ncbi:hypothetical protein ABL78_7237 [Leptomonas seymouri]|uniref:SET domain-containing protein n=1 Tax=Leptomonas seymouri TaxID=5684 RepID=A0A0N0P3I8_LEPSE|nr:hypothetical protein ABL78_7237 [Leptomonas seymouri]|eukprot:KPI83717.1 hypothetical protein ABL78_7237 [Leptomonas seymouri]